MPETSPRGSAAGLSWPFFASLGHSLLRRPRSSVQVPAAKLLALRSQGAKCSYDLTGVCETLGRTIVGQGVTLVVAEIAAELAAAAHIARE